MILVRRPTCRIVLLALALLAPAANGQGLSSSSGASLAIATLTESNYAAGASDPTTSYALTTTCTGTTSAGCRLFLQYGINSQGQQVDMEYAIVSATADCAGVVADPNVWLPLQPSAAVLSTAKNKSCAVAFRFRAGPVTWSVYQSPGPPGGTYRQQVNFVFTRP
jgi:hypothetical protein